MFFEKTREIQKPSVWSWMKNFAEEYCPLPPGVQVWPEVLTVLAPLAGAVKEPVGCDVWPPVEGAPPQPSVGVGDLLAALDVPGGDEAEAVARPV